VVDEQRAFVAGRHLVDRLVAGAVEQRDGRDDEQRGQRAADPVEAVEPEQVAAGRVDEQRRRRGDVEDEREQQDCEPAGRRVPRTPPAV
jgi:hypothetical protein